MEQLPRTQQSESAGYRDMGTDTSNGQIMLTRPHQARVITTLPLEIQSEILSHVSTLSDQISISQTCKLWQTIIWECKSCQRQRYARVSEEVDIHKFIKYDKPLIKWLSCTFENGNVNQYRYKQYEFEKEEDSETSSRWRWQDLTNFKFLDDPVVSPFCQVPEFFNGERGDKGKNVLFINRIYRWPPSALFFGRRSWEGLNLPEFLELNTSSRGRGEEEEEEEGSELDSNKEECWQSIRISLEFPKCPASLGVFYRTFAFVPADTTVRGLLQSIVEEIQPVMKKWEFDSSVEHELIFSSIRDLNHEFEDDPIDIYLELKCDIPFIPGKDRSWVETTRSANDQSAASADA
ncbi:hypothetical protein AOL_s00081g58 [Orbilia oligospora ATCC 24927]|uniref:F-box domain-containing protein n=1 Tax=Arthrobotrys oligospora (strain ATCC 24927 / CBS 115.81 / DSM 1491) TaxID=756982 RepID=G1XFB7_ARTOA|nr:hypothetical protein AOL_s00081g58 [Orbilia oligospora ATCC 24927]EGX48195.1 hypothetical protein AOL_s00081g58 [Orbilia oligospora ATCC 24927]